jgi:hypothetical protein
MNAALSPNTADSRAFCFCPSRPLPLLLHLQTCIRLLHLQDLPCHTVMIAVAASILT